MPWAVEGHRARTSDSGSGLGLLGGAVPRADAARGAGAQPRTSAVVPSSELEPVPTFGARGHRASTGLKVSVVAESRPFRGFYVPKASGRTAAGEPPALRAGGGRERRGLHQELEENRRGAGGGLSAGALRPRGKTAPRSGALRTALRAPSLPSSPKKRVRGVIKAGGVRGGEAERGRRLSRRCRPRPPSRSRKPSPS